MGALAGRLSVAVLTHNRPEELCRTLDQLLSLPEPPAIVVADNASGPETSERLVRYSAVRCVRLERNIGAAARNEAVTRAATPFVALCDDDTWWQAGSLELALELFERYPRLAVVTAKVLVGDGGRVDPISELMGESPLAPRIPGTHTILGMLAGASVVRCSAFLDAGGFNARFFLGGEEELLALDLASAGWWSVYAPELVVRHMPSENRDRDRRRSSLYRNRILVAMLRRSWRETCRRLGETAWRATHDRRAARGLVMAMGAAPRFLRSRRRISAELERDVEAVEAAERAWEKRRRARARSSGVGVAAPE